MKQILLAALSAALILTLAFCDRETPNQTPAEISKAATNAELVNAENTSWASWVTMIATHI